MPHPKEICIEDLELSEREGTANQAPYIRCVALPGGEPGLALAGEGMVRWMPDGPAARGLWISADERLVLLRAANAGPITVERGGRRVEAPEGKPVILVDQDLLRVNGRRLRVHIHGAAEAIYPPRPLTAGAIARLGRAAAAALALGAVVGTPGSGEARAPGPPPIEIRAQPPAPPVQARPVECTITAMKPSETAVMVHATCRGASGITKGLFGTILDPRTGRAMVDGQVMVKEVNKGKVVCVTMKLTKPVKATTIRFMVP